MSVSEVTPRSGKRGKREREELERQRGVTRSEFFRVVMHELISHSMTGIEARP